MLLRLLQGLAWLFTKTLPAETSLKLLEALKLVLHTDVGKGKSGKIKKSARRDMTEDPGEFKVQH